MSAYVIRRASDAWAIVPVVDGLALIYVCRDIECDHAGGPDCLCVPFRLRAEESIALPSDQRHA